MLKVRFRDGGATYEGTVRGDEYLADGETFDPGAVELLPPCTPSKVIATGMNYSEHVERITDEAYEKPDEPVFFFKPPSSVVPDGAPVVDHPTVDFLDYEAELAVVIGAECADVSPDEALEYVGGYTCLNDVTSRDWIIREDGQLRARGKGLDTFCPIGPYLQTDVDHPVDVIGRVNGEVRQDSDTSHLLFSVEELIADASRYFTLHPGDVIATGTPPGTAAEEVPFDEWDERSGDLALSPGDVVEVEIPSIGTLENPVVAP